MMPAPNQNFIEKGAVPNANYYQGAVPNLTTASNYGGRFDYNVSSSDRFFFRVRGHEVPRAARRLDVRDEPKYKGLHINDKTRARGRTPAAGRKCSGSTVVDTSVSTNRFYEDQQRRGLHEYKPTDVGLPSYLDDFCTAAHNCMMPVINVDGLPGHGLDTANGGLHSTNVQGQSNVTSVKGAHTLRGGVDYRLAMGGSGLIAAGNVKSTYKFDNTYTRAADTTAVFRAATSARASRR